MYFRVVMFLSCFFLFVSCGGGGGDSRLGPVPTSGASGVAHDNILIRSTITVQRYTNGAVLGTAVTNQEGNYSVSFQSENTPVLITATGGYYYEESSGVKVYLASGQKLYAVANFSTGNAITVQVTPYTHVAAGLAEYYIGQGMSAPAAINAANQVVSDALKFNVLTTRPVDITDPKNATASLSYEAAYGFMSAAISSWTRFASEQNGDTSQNGKLHTAYNSISLAQVMYDDIKADGVLDGMGRDASNHAISLTFGVVPITTHVYRHALAAHTIVIANNANVNQTGLTEAQLLPFAAPYAGHVGSLFRSDVTPLSFANAGRPQIIIPDPGWLGNTAHVTATVSSAGILLSGTLSIGGATVANAAINGTGMTFTFDSSSYSEGNKTAVITAMDSYGVSSSQTATLAFDHTSPIVNPNGTAVCATDLGGCDGCTGTLTCVFRMCGNTSDSVSGVKVVTNTNFPADIPPVVPDASGNFCTYHTESFYFGHPVETRSYTYNVQDVSGNVSVYRGDMTIYWTILEYDWWYTLGMTFTRL